MSLQQKTGSCINPTPMLPLEHQHRAWLLVLPALKLGPIPGSSAAVRGYLRF